MQTNIDKTEKFGILKEYFGHDSFRPGQEDVIDSVLSGRDVVAVMPTGAGKSVCYLVPALMFRGVTLVISPLISLMHDQVMSLVRSGVAGAYVNSTLSYAQYDKVLGNISDGKYKIIYAAPERLSSESFAHVCSKLDISFVAVDEAHCVSQWGQDFRPSYLKIKDFIEGLPSRPVVGAFTATATQNVRLDIIKLLSLCEPRCVTTGFDRPNLFFSVLHPRTKWVTLLELVKERRLLSGIIYCSTRVNVEKVCGLLNDNGIKATMYHAGLSDETRRRNQEDFVCDRVPVMVATNAFGMGIDKSNVSYIIHYNMPKDLESYYQEAGRAGRDGGEAECILMYAKDDVDTARFFIENSERGELSEKERRQIRLRDETRLKYMAVYCTTNDCLRSYMLRYFGESASDSCGRCSNCLTNYETADITVEAQKILSCIARTRQSCGVKMICDILTGKTNERIESLGFDKLSTFGIMSDLSESALRSIINSLVTLDIIAQSGGENPVLTLTENSAPVLKGERTVETRVIKETNQPAPKGEKNGDTKLFERLGALRKKLADSSGVPAYVVFTDAVLREMCVIKPQSRACLMKISGVDRRRLERYGEKFIGEIAAYLSEKGGQDGEK